MNRLMACSNALLSLSRAPIIRSKFFSRITISCLLRSISLPRSNILEPQNSVCESRRGQLKQRALTVSRQGTAANVVGFCHQVEQTVVPSSVRESQCPFPVSEYQWGHIRR